MIHAHFINPLFQFGKKEFDLLLKDEGDNVLSRSHFSFSENVTEQELESRAAESVAIYKEENPDIDDSVIETSVDLPIGVEI